MTSAPASPPGRFAARLFDGAGADSRSVWVSVTPDGLRVEETGGEARVWSFNALVLARGDAKGEPVQLEHRGPPVEVVIVDDGALLQELRAALPRSMRLARPRGMAVTGRLLFALTLLAVVVVVAAYRLGVPAVADFATEQVPHAWERDFGNAVVADFVANADRERDPVIVAPVQALHGRLAAASEGLARKSRLVVAKQDMVNAFAAPGGTVVVTTGLLRAVRTPEELAAVLAHELGHVRRRHPLRGMMRQVSLQALLGLVAGDASALSGSLRVAGQLGGLSFSRGYEREADDDALDLMSGQGISPLALSRALESIAGSAPAGVEIGFLSTHPTTKGRHERIARAAADAGRAPRVPLIAEAAWRKMKRALPDTTR